MAGKRGRPRKPAATHKLAGTFRPDRHKKNEPRPEGEPYQIEKLEGFAAELWDRVVPELVRMKIATAIDSPQLFAMCQWWQEFRELQSDIEMDPYKRTCAMAGAYKQFGAIAAKFGLTAADRANLDIDDGEEEDSPFAALLARRQTKN